MEYIDIRKEDKYWSTVKDRRIEDFTKLRNKKCSKRMYSRLEQRSSTTKGTVGDQLE